MDTLWKRNDAQLVCIVAHRGEVMGYVVVDSTIGGRSCGGLRLLPDVDEAEMRGLARAMTLKYGFLGLPQGGAKAGVKGDPEAPLAERRARLAAFGQAIAPLLRNRIYAPGTDMGTDNADIRFMLHAVGVPVKPRELRGTQSGYHTALTVFTSAKRAANHLGLRLAGASAAIEGFGKVGSALASLLADGGVRVVAVSTSRGAIYNPRGLDARLMTKLSGEAGSRLVDLYPDAERIDRAALLELPVDLLCPCARHDSVHIGNASRITAPIICPGANNPITVDAERILFERGILCLPDFVANCGGVLGGTMEFASVGRKQIASFIADRVGARITRLLEEAKRRQISPREVAGPLALRRFEEMRHDADRPALKRQSFELGLELYRRGWIPCRLVAALSSSYFNSRL